MATDWVLVGSTEKRVLIIDDAPSGSAVLPVLAAVGVKADLARDCVTAEALLTAHEYAVIVIDPGLTCEPAGRGAELLYCAHRLHPSARILVTAGDDAPELGMILNQSDRITTVAKPQSVRLLADLIDRQLAIQPLAGRIPQIAVKS